MGNQADFRVDRLQALQGRIDLAHADAGTVVDHLALQVGQVDGVEVGQVQLTHPGGGQVQGDWRAKATEPGRSAPCSA